MIRLIKAFVWVFLFGILFLAIDQFFVQVAPTHPAHATARDFYLDFRKRFLATVVETGKEPTESIEAVIDQQQKAGRKLSPGLYDKPGTSETTMPSRSSSESQRYIYSDQNGELQFADSLDEVPEDLRWQAQPIGQ
jgi:hypothetical protein